MKVRKKGFDHGYYHSEDKQHSHGKSTREKERIWQRTMRRRLDREVLRDFEKGEEE